MAVEILEVLNISERAADLGLAIPTHLALLPRNFIDAESSHDLVDERHATTIRKLWRDAGIEETSIAPQGRFFPTILERSAEWITPTVFVGSLLLTQNPHAVSIALGVVQNYATDMLKGRFGQPTVRMDVIVESTAKKRYYRVSYTGPVDGLSDLSDIVREAAKRR